MFPILLILPLISSVESLRSATKCTVFPRFLSKLQTSSSGPEVTPAAVQQQSIKERLNSDMKAAMKNKEKLRLSAIRAINTAIKQKEVDERVSVTDEIAVEIMSKMLKQRKESILSYSNAGRADLVEQEEGECLVIKSYMPESFDSETIEKMITESISRLEAKSVKDMAKVMADLKPRLVGKADISEVGAIIKKKLS